jgi:Fusaric acid resistance protein family
MIGTVVGATIIVVLTACFPQDRVAFLVLLAFWCGLCRLRRHGAPPAALAGYTAAIIAADTLGATVAQAQTFSYRRSGVPAISASGSCAPVWSSPGPISAVPGGDSRVH